MSRSVPPGRVPTLTEVLDQSVDHIASATATEPPDSSASSGPAVSVGVPSISPASADADMAQAITADLQAHIDRVLDARVRAALEPVLQQLVTRVLEETRRELASTLRDGMARALAQQNARHRNGT